MRVRGQRGRACTENARRPPPKSTGRDLLAWCTEHALRRGRQQRTCGFWLRRPRTADLMTMRGSHGKTFNSAAKHLFRHLHDAKELRKNPIARHVLDAADDRWPALNDSDILSRLHAAVMAAAGRIRDADYPTERGTRLDRRFRIVRMECLERLPLPKIAATLRISVKHCYRERAHICRLIAQDLLAISPHPTSLTPSEEAFYFLLDRLSDNDGATPNASLQALQYLESVARAPQQRILAISAAAVLFAGYVDGVRAEAEATRAAAIYNAEFFDIPPFLRSMVGASVKAAKWLIDYNRGDMQNCLLAAHEAVRFADEMPALDIPYAQSLWVSAHFSLAAALWNAGELERGYEELSQAASRSEAPGVQKQLRLWTQVSLWKLRSYLATKSRRYTTHARLENLNALYMEARQSGSFLLAAEALLSIVECQAFAGRDQEALRIARTLLAVAKEAHNPVVEAQMAIDAGVRLLGTRFWRQGLEFITRYRAVENVGFYHRSLVDLSTAVGALRSGDFENARRRAHAGELGARPSQLRLRFRLVGAESAYRAGQRSVAREAAADIVDAAERLGSTPLLREAYALATGVLGRRQFESRAQEMARILGS